MSEIFLAEQEWGGGVRHVVLKRLLPTLARDPEHRALFMEEARVASLLQHPAIPSVYGLVEDSGLPSLIMEWVRGCSLRELQASVRAGVMPAFSVPETVWVATQLLDVLEYLFGLRGPDGEPAPMYHRDLAPENILIDINGRIRLIDFGIAKVASSELATRTGVLKGRLAYLPPEITRGEPFGPTGDLYALSLILAEILSGQIPGFARDDASQIASLRERTGPPDLARDLPGRELFIRCLDPYPEIRPQSPGVFRRELELSLGIPSQKAQESLKARVEALFVDRKLSLQPETAGLYWGDPTPPLSTKVAKTGAEVASTGESVAGRIFVAATIALVAALSWTYENRLWGDTSAVTASSISAETDVQQSGLPGIQQKNTVQPPGLVEIVPSVRGELVVSGISHGQISERRTIELPAGSYTIELRSPPRRFYRADIRIAPGEKFLWEPKDSPLWEP